MYNQVQKDNIVMCTLIAIYVCDILLVISSVTIAATEELLTAFPVPQKNRLLLKCQTRRGVGGPHYIVGPL